MEVVDTIILYLPRRRERKNFSHIFDSPKFFGGVLNDVDGWQVFRNLFKTFVCCLLVQT